MLSERVSLNDYIPLVEYVVIARHIRNSQVIRLCQLVSNPDKKLPDKPKLTLPKIFIYRQVLLQDSLIFGSVFTLLTQEKPAAKFAIILNKS